MLGSSIYNMVVVRYTIWYFVSDLTFLNEVAKSDNILKSIEVIVIDSCIEVIIRLPDIRSHQLVHRILSKFDTPDPTYLVPQGH